MPLDQQIAALLEQIEPCPALYIGDGTDLHALFHFLNGWQCAMSHTAAGSLNGKMNAYLALRYHDLNASNWLHLIEKYEDAPDKVNRFFALFHEMQREYP